VRAYADTGLLCSLYTPDAHTAAAVARVKKAEAALPVLWLHHLELRNALRLRVFRREISGPQKEASLNLFLADLADGVLTAAEVELSDLTREAERLSAAHSEKLGTRSLDILHVAVALVLGAREFWTFDHRQAALAKAAGLRVPG
jgi:predicted nucleic acid-binding protein